MSELTEALTALQANLPVIGKGNTATVPTKTGGSYKYKYATLDEVSAAILPLLSENGLAWVTGPTLHEGAFTLHYQLRHTSGEVFEGFYPLPNVSPQEIGSAVTYARRYALCAVTGVAPGGDDDDAAAATKAHNAPSKTEAPKVAPAPVVDERTAHLWITTINAAETISQLQAAWEGAGAEGVTRDPKVIAAKDKRKQELTNA